MAKRSRQSDVVERAQEDLFAEEYCVDFDPIAAALRSGVPRLQAKQKAKLFLQDRAVLVAIQKRIDDMLPEQIVTPQRVLAGLMREGRTAFLDGVRVQALKEAYTILRDTQESEYRNTQRKDADEKKRRGSGVMVVPGMPALTDWEAAAREQQAKLKEQVKE